MPQASSIVTEIAHLFEAKPIKGIACFLQTEDGHRLKITHRLRRYQSHSSSNARREFAYLGEARQGRRQLIQLVVNVFNITDLFLVLPPPGHIATLEANMARECIPVLTADNGVTEKLGAHQSCFMPFEMILLNF